VSGALVVVATPIGNLGDVSARTRDELERADAIYCEDTRRTRQLLSALGIRGGGRLVSLHEHNEQSRVDEVVGRVGGGERVVLVSDAGTPGVSDPGGRVCAAVAAAGLEVTAIPGPSAALAALVVSGLASERFVFEGFLPRRGAARERVISSLVDEARTIVLFESPQRLGATLEDLSATLGERRAVVARELTKLHEEVVRGTLGELAERYASGDVLGEVVVVIEGSFAPPAEIDDATLSAALASELAAGASVRDAASSVAGVFGVSQRRAYELALDIRRDRQR
jgi:16S rRNA (cytidine1402-2'-O)-methyltransferase